MVWYNCRKHALEVMGPYRRKSNDSPILFTHPSLFSADQTQLLTQTAFERLNLPAIALIPRSLASLYAVGSTTGICVDIGYKSSTITPVVDTVIYSHTIVEVKMGLKHCEAYLAKLLAQDPKITAVLSSPPPPPPAPEPTDPSSSTDPSSLSIPPTYPETPLPETLLRLSHHLFSLGLIRPNLMNGQRLTVEQEEEGVTDIAAALVAASRTAASKSHKSAARQAEDAKRKAKADSTAAGMDVMLVEFEGREVSVGVVRHRFCEPLFDPTLMKEVEMDGKVGGVGELPVLALQEAVELSVGSILNAHERLGVWDGVVIVGEAARMKSELLAFLPLLKSYRC
jgi:actin-related protein 9